MFFLLLNKNNPNATTAPIDAINTHPNDEGSIIDDSVIISPVVHPDSSKVAKNIPSFIVIISK